MRLSEISESIEKFVSQGVWLNNAFDVWNETEGQDAKDRLQALADYIAVTTDDKDKTETIYADIEAEFIDTFGQFEPDMVNDDNVEELLSMRSLSVLLVSNLILLFPGKYNLTPVLPR